MPDNSIAVIKPYRWEGMWVFDDDRVGLVKEPFVGGADTLIDLAVEQQGIENAADGFLLLFSTGPFPGGDIRLDWVREEAGGNIYIWKEMNKDGWLCPALLKYFREPPPALYVQLRNAG